MNQPPNLQDLCAAAGQKLAKEYGLEDLFMKAATIQNQCSSKGLGEKASAEPPFTDKGREVIEELNAKLEAKTEEVDRLMAEMHFNERKAIVLSDELMSRDSKNKEIEESKKVVIRKENEIWKLRKIIMVVIGISFVILFKK
ncbi:hypothetical protein AgCh_000917 [Apium graveolens]